MSSKFNTAQFKRTTKKAFRSWTNWAVGFNQNMQIQKKKKKRDECGTLSSIVLQSRSTVHEPKCPKCLFFKRRQSRSRADVKPAEDYGYFWRFWKYIYFLSEAVSAGTSKVNCKEGKHSPAAFKMKKKVVLLWYSEDIVIWNLQIRTKTPATDRFPSDHSELLSSWRPVGSTGMVGWALGAWTPPAGVMLLSSWLDQK